MKSHSTIDTIANFQNARQSMKGEYRLQLQAIPEALAARYGRDATYATLTLPYVCVGKQEDGRMCVAVERGEHPLDSETVRLVRRSRTVSALSDKLAIKAARTHLKDVLQGDFCAEVVSIKPAKYDTPMRTRELPRVHNYLEASIVLY